MQRVYVYSDESSRKGGEAVFVVAGLAIEAYHNVVWRALQEAEEKSGKGLRDWHSTRDPKTRRRYLEAALAIPEIEGRVFYRVYEPLLADPWSATVETLAEVVERFGGEEKTCVLAHEGFTKGSREKLKRAVERSPAAGNIEVASGNLNGSPMIRLADSLAGLLRLLSGDPERANRFEDMKQEWFIELG